MQSTAFVQRNDGKFLCFQKRVLAVDWTLSFFFRCVWWYAYLMLTKWMPLRLTIDLYTTNKTQTLFIVAVIAFNETECWRLHVPRSPPFPFILLCLITCYFNIINYSFFFCFCRDMSTNQVGKRYACDVNLRSIKLQLLCVRMTATRAKKMLLFFFQFNSVSFACCPFAPRLSHTHNLATYKHKRIYAFVRNH